jgi:hypothetical protein
LLLEFLVQHEKPQHYILKVGMLTQNDGRKNRIIAVRQTSRHRPA